MRVILNDAQTRLLGDHKKTPRRDKDGNGAATEKSKLDTAQPYELARNEWRGNWHTYNPHKRKLLKGSKLKRGAIINARGEVLEVLKERREVKRAMRDPVARGRQQQVNDMVEDLAATMRIS